MSSTPSETCRVKPDSSLAPARQSHPFIGRRERHQLIYDYTITTITLRRSRNAGKRRDLVLDGVTRVVEVNAATFVFFFLPVQ